jgi:RNA polymerase sigma-70 factor (ECF subfamily)
VTDTETSLVEPFLASVDDTLRADLASMEDLEEKLISIVSDARDTWRTVFVPADVFVSYVGARMPTDRPPADGLEAVRASDLYLACACACGDSTAIVLFDKSYVSVIDLALARMRMAKASVDEVKQLVRQKLFVAEKGKEGKISAYSGRGDLGRWVRSIAVRTALNFMRKGKREILMEDDKVMRGVSAAGDDPELAYIKDRYRTEFRQAFVDALGSLDDRQQALLRYYHVDSLNIDAIGTIYKVHRVTAYRWLEKARDALVHKTLGLLKERLNVEKNEFDSILRMIRSQLHLSLHRHLGNLGGGENDN